MRYPSLNAGEKVVLQDHDANIHHPRRFPQGWRRAIDVLSRKYGIQFVGGNLRSLYKFEFTAALKASSLLVQIPLEELNTLDDFSVFNDLSLVSMQAVLWGKDDKDVTKWRANFSQHVDKGWGPAFRLVSGPSMENKAIDQYYTAYIKRDQDNDIILGQRPHKYLSGQFPEPQFRQTGVEGEWLVLDYIILKGLELIWR